MTDALSALDAVAEVGDVGGLDDAGRLQLDRGRTLVEQPRAAAGMWKGGSSPHQPHHWSSPQGPGPATKPSTETDI